PWLNMFGAFFTIACRAGSSEILHLDWNDDPRLWTLMFCVGGPEGWVGGDFCLPQLGLRIPMREGTLVACLTKRLVHCATAVTQG
ncbi:hypothetical protein PUNSTDRAFT_31691, partial [Punctularia strigosozonata HHB-11173 SS5]|uniref:uncharacterized protein n=1 Tax=Punctularia strigosozonata (strain HHB-11173) TaxID=741275 RepID=UPI00044163D7